MNIMKDRHGLAFHPVNLLDFVHPLMQPLCLLKPCLLLGVGHLTGGTCTIHLHIKVDLDLDGSINA